MDAGRTRLDLDLDLRDEPISGELTPPGGSPRPFTGYTGLIAAVEAIRDLQGNGTGPNATDGVAPGPLQRGDSL
jgi:hypothetical protein